MTTHSTAHFFMMRRWPTPDWVDFESGKIGQKSTVHARALLLLGEDETCAARARGKNPVRWQRSDHFGRRWRCPCLLFQHDTNGAGLAPPHKLLRTTWIWSLSPILNVTEAPIPMWLHSVSDGCSPPTDREVGSCSSYAEVAGRENGICRARRRAVATACVNRGGASPFPRSLPLLGLVVA